MNSIYQQLAEIEKNNQSAALCTVVKSQGSTPRHETSKMIVYPDRNISGSIGGGELENRVIKEALESMMDGKARNLSYNMSDPEQGDPGVCGGQVEIFVEPINPKPVLIVIGAGHVGKAVAYLAHWLGYYVVVNDDRPEFSHPDAIPGGDKYITGSMADLPMQIEITPWTYIALCTRGVAVDMPGLPVLLDSNAAYIGVIGSRRRWATTRRKLSELGVSEEKLLKVNSRLV
jgi:xanthine dehydrogenase accessory factor